MSKKKKHIIAIVLFYGYVIVVLWITIFSRHSPTGKNMLMHLFLVFDVRTWKKESIRHKQQHIHYNIMSRMPTHIAKECCILPKWMVLSAVILSVLIEVSQLLFQLGWAEIDDIVNNAVGAFIGYKVFGRIITK